MRTAVRWAVVGILLACAAAATAGDIPRSARLVKEAGNQFLAAKRYADAIDCYLQAVQICPAFPEAHYNLGVAFLKGYRAYRLARHHFERYLELRPEAQDRESVRALVAALAQRERPLPEEPGQVVAVVGGRLLVSGGGWVKQGQLLEVAVEGETPCAKMLADYVYPDCVLTQRIRDRETLEKLRPGLVAMTR